MKYSALLMSVVCVAVLTSCSWLEEWPPAEREFTKRTPEPQPRVMQTSDATWLAPSQMTPVEVSHSGPQRDEAAMDRLEKLERDVADLRSEIGMMLPALTRLAQAQTDFQTVLKQYQPQGAASYAPAQAQPQAQAMTASVGHMPSYPPATQAAAAPYPAAAAPYAPTPAPATGLTVRQVRFGEHGDKTRMVLDMTGTVKFRYDLDNSEQILVLDLPQSSWQGAVQNVLNNAPLVASYSATPDGHGGTRMAVQLRKPVKVLWADNMPPAAGKGYRIVVDLAPL